MVMDLSESMKLFMLPEETINAASPTDCISVVLPTFQNRHPYHDLEYANFHITQFTSRTIKHA